MGLTTAVMAQHGLLFMGMAESIGWNWGVVLTEVRFRKIADGWQCIVKGLYRERRGVAFVNCPTLQGCLAEAGRMAHTGELAWRRDRYPPK